MDEQRCPECETDIAAMNADAFARHMEAEHPQTYDIIRRVLESFQ